MVFFSFLRRSDAVGQRVRTSFGDGTILAFFKGTPTTGPRYRIKLDFGIGFINPSSIMHGVWEEGSPKYVRHDGIMRKDGDATEGNSSSALLDKKFKLLFGSDQIYLLIRLFNFLVNALDEVETWMVANPLSEARASGYYNPIKSQEPKEEARLDFRTFLVNLQQVGSKDMTTKDFEGLCRSISKEMVHKMSALPKLVEKCAEALIQTAKEDLLPQLFDYCQFTGAVREQSCHHSCVRSFVLAFVPI